MSASTTASPSASAPIRRKVLQGVGAHPASHARSAVTCSRAPAPAAAFLCKGKGRMGGKRSRTVAWKTHRTAKEKQLFRPDPAPWAALTHPWDSPVGGRGVLHLCAERQPLIAAGGHHHGTAGRRPACSDDLALWEAGIIIRTAELHTPSYSTVLPLPTTSTTHRPPIFALNLENYHSKY